VAWRLFATHAALSFAQRDSVLVMDFDNQTGEARFDRALLSALTVSLNQSRKFNVASRARVADAMRRMGKTPDQRVDISIGRELAQREGLRALLACGITRAGHQYELTAELIDPQTGEALLFPARRGRRAGPQRTRFAGIGDPSGPWRVALLRSA
jgi:TolB-like protein